MNPYHSVVVAQHNRSLVRVARSARAGATTADSATGLLGRIRDAAAGVWSLAASSPAAVPQLHDYPTGTAV